MTIYIRRIRTVGGDGICILLDAVGPRVKLGNLGDGIDLVEGFQFDIDWVLFYDIYRAKKRAGNCHHHGGP